MTLPVTSNASSLATRLSFAAALIFTSASTGTNLLYGWNKGTDAYTSLVWAAVSVGVSIVFVLSWPALLRALDARQWAGAVMALIALLLTGTYSVSAALGSAMGGRENAAFEEKSAAESRVKAQSTYDRAKRELEALAQARPSAELAALIAPTREELTRLAPARPPAELQALVDGVKADPRSGDCVAIQGSSRMRCPKVAEWKAEKARSETREKLAANLNAWIDEKGRAEQREALKSEIDVAGSELARIGPAKLVNSDAAALSAYLSAIGITTSPERMNKLLVLLAVLVIECGGGLAFAVGTSLSAPDRSHGASPDRAIGPPSSPVQTAAPYPIQTEFASALTHFPASNPPTPRTDGPIGTSHQRFFDLLRDRGGQIVLGQRALADALGISKTHVNRLLRDLSAAGRVIVEPGPRGTAIRLC